MPFNNTEFGYAEESKSTIIWREVKGALLALGVLALGMMFHLI